MSDTKKIAFESIELKKVLVKGLEPKTITVEVVPFDPYNDEHVEFSYAYSDMLYRMPSAFKDVSEASRTYVKKFMVHTGEDEDNAESDFNRVYNDLRACRVLFHKETISKALNDFFANA